MSAPTAPRGLALVTGATGFVGSAVARAALEAGFKVRVLARPGSDRRNLEGLAAERVEGDLLDPPSVERALAGAEVLFHVAADYRLWAPDPEEIVRNNLAGVRTALTAARTAGVRRVVYTSSVATLRLDPHGRPATEDQPMAPEEAVGAYKRSKTLAERWALEFAASSGLDLVVVNPSTPIGPRDVKPTPTGRIIVEAASGRMPAFVDTGLNLVHVDDVAVGHILAHDRGRTGERYILGGQDASLETLLGRIAALTGRRPPRVRLPIAPLEPLAVAAEALARITGREPFLTRDALKMSRHAMFFSSAKAEGELGYRARPYEEALRDALAWFAAEGRIG